MAWPTKFPKRWDYDTSSDYQTAIRLWSVTNGVEYAIPDAYLTLHLPITTPGDVEDDYGERSFP
jgi:hypothetical protein